MPPPPLPAHLAFLFRFDAWANRAVAAALASDAARGSGVDPVRVGEAARLFAHLTRAAEVWLGRVEGTEAAGLPIWPDDTDVTASAARGARAAAGWQARLRAASDAGLGRGVRYTNSRGERFETALAEIAAHVVTHGSHHRGQVARLLREAGLAPPALDLIAYARSPERRPRDLGRPRLGPAA